MNLLYYSQPARRVRPSHILDGEGPYNLRLVQVFALLYPFIQTLRDTSQL